MKRMFLLFVTATITIGEIYPQCASFCLISGNVQQFFTDYNAASNLALIRKTAGQIGPITGIVQEPYVQNSAVYPEITSYIMTGIGRGGMGDGHMNSRKRIPAVCGGVSEQKGYHLGIEDSSQLAARSFNLSQNYLNPFSSSTTIKYWLPQSCCCIKLKIFDTFGKEVKTFVNSIQGFDEHWIIWRAVDNNLNPIPSGDYFYCIESGKIRLNSGERIPRCLRQG